MGRNIKGLACNSTSASYFDKSWLHSWNELLPKAVHCLAHDSYECIGNYIYKWCASASVFHVNIPPTKYNSVPQKVQWLPHQ